MASNLPRYTLRVPQILLDKFRYIAGENARSVNKELELMMRQRIKAYEEEFGPIPLPDE